MTDTTVIFPSFNMQSDVIQAISSVLEQDIGCHIVVIDDFSHPPIELPAKWLGNAKIKLIRQLENKGSAAARNVGIKACKTDWLTFLDSDDLLLPGTLERRLQFAKDTMNQENGGLNLGNTFFCCGWINPRLDDDSQQIRIPNPANSPEEFASGCWYSPGSCALFHRSFFDAPDRKYDENLRRLEDFDWGIRAGLSGARMISHPIAGVSIKPSNKTNLQAIKTASAYMLEKFSHLQRSQPKVYASLSAYLALEQATFSFHENKWLNASISLVRSYIARPRFRRHFSPRWTFEKYKPVAIKGVKS